MQLICQVWKETVHSVQNYDLLGIMSTRMSLYNIYDIILGSMETQYLISVGGNSVTHYKTLIKCC